MAQPPAKAGQNASAADEGSEGGSRRRRAWLAAAVAVMALLGAGAYVGISQAQDRAYAASLRPVGIPATISTALANYLQLATVPGKAAPGFTLTDQHAEKFSLNAFRGKAVVLEFMDPHCTDICPIISAEFVDAYHDLGTDARNVVFLAINVNPYHNKIADVTAFTTEHGLTAIPSWHFFTGPVATLKKVWASYDVLVQAPSPTADVVHTSTVYFISPDGREAFEGQPMDDHTASGTAYLPAGQIAEWGQGIALVARHMIG